jgi:prolipoprotein diacylglyceryltransferase
LGTFPRGKPEVNGTFSGSAAWLYHVTNLGLSTDATASLPVHPTQLYEAAFALCAAVVAYFFLKPKPFGGKRFLLMAMVLGTGRYCLEFLRGDPDRGLLSIAHSHRVKILGSWSQLMAFGSVLVAALVWRQWQNGRKTWDGIFRLYRAEPTK